MEMSAEALKLNLRELWKGGANANSVCDVAVGPQFNWETTMKPVSQGGEF